MGESVSSETLKLRYDTFEEKSTVFFGAFSAAIANDFSDILPFETETFSFR